MFLTDFDRAVIRGWSAVVARGEEGNTSDVRAELAAKGVELKCDDLGKRLAMLHREGQLP